MCFIVCCQNFCLIKLFSKFKFSYLLTHTHDRTRVYIFSLITLIKDILDLSGSLGHELGLISIDHEKAFDGVEHQYLWQTLKVLGSVLVW